MVKPLRRFTPGCPCCVECVVLDDTFTRGDEELGASANWAEQAGDWEVSGNEVILNTPTANDHATVDLDHAPVQASFAQYAIEVDVKADTSGDELGAFVAWTDASN